MIKTNDPVEFMLHYTTYTTCETLALRVQRHKEYKTCRIVVDPLDGSIVCVCLWNVSADGKVAHVIDLVIREDWRNKGLVQRILEDGRKIWPIEKLTWERGYDDGLIDKPMKIWSVERFLRRKI